MWREERRKQGIAGTLKRGIVLDRGFGVDAAVSKEPKVVSKLPRAITSYVRECRTCDI